MQTPPPNYTNYYRPSAPTPGYIPGPPEVNFRVIGQAWQMASRESNTWAVLSFVFVCLLYGGNLLVNLGVNRALYGSWIVDTPIGSPIYLQRTGVSYAFRPLLEILLTPLMAGFCNAAIMRVEGQKVNLLDMFSGFSRFGALAVTGFLMSLATMIGMYLLVLPGLYLFAAFSFAPLLVLRQGLGPIEAMQKSMQVLSGTRSISMFFLLFLLTLLSFVGAIACGIGVILTFAVMPIGLGMTYNNFFPSKPSAPPVGYAAPAGYTPGPAGYEVPSKNAAGPNAAANPGSEPSSSTQ